MTASYIKELKELLEDLKKNPSNLDLINKVAIGYFETPNLNNKKDYYYFEKAYNLKKTVKSTNNFAWFLYFEWSEIEWRWNEDLAIEKAFKIQQECIELNPKSYYPYYQYGYMLLDQKKCLEAIPLLEKANSIKNQRDITHNLGYCHFHIGNYQIAYDLFGESVNKKDRENKSLFNLALTAFKLKKLEEVKIIAEKLFAEIETNNNTSICAYEIGILFYLLKDYQKVKACLLNHGLENIDLYDWPELSYSLNMTDREIWKNNISEGIKERTEWISEIERNHEDCSYYSEEEKQERLVELKNEIVARMELLSTPMTKPPLNLSRYILDEYCDCLLFDCKRHGNLKDDK